MANETRTTVEGSLRIAAASATGGGWVTAATPATALVGLVRMGMSVNSAEDYVAIMDRGQFHHWKFQGTKPIEVQFEFLEAVTANNPAKLRATAGGASVQMLHMELKYKAPESADALWRQFHHGVLVSDNWKDSDQGNSNTQTWRFASMTGPTGSGYLSTALQ